MSFIITQQVQPAFIMAVMQSQQAWIMSQQALSPLVQVMQQPSSVISHLHMPMVRLQQQTIMPFIMQQQRAHAAGHHRAEVLHHAAGHLVVAGAGDLHAAGALLHLHRAAGHHHQFMAGVGPVIVPGMPMGCSSCQSCSSGSSSRIPSFHLLVARFAVIFRDRGSLNDIRVEFVPRHHKRSGNGFNFDSIGVRFFWR